MLPPAGLVLLALTGLALSLRYPRAGRMVAAAAVLALLALSLPITSSLLVDALDPPAPFAAADAQGAEAIVILGGGIRHDAPDYGGEDTLSALTLERVRYGARIARMTRLPVLVSGGGLDGATSEAVLMQRALEDEFGVPVRWLETASLNTHENAVMSASVLKAAGVHKVVLVMHAFDMRRATAEFRSQGITAVPAATNLPAHGASTWFDWVPSMAGLYASYYACYEILANLVRALQSGRHVNLRRSRSAFSRADPQDLPPATAMRRRTCRRARAAPPSPGFRGPG